MPSDSRLDLIREQVAPQAVAYREAVLLAVDEVAVMLREVGVNATAEHAPMFAASLGSFGAVHLDTDRLASFFDGNRSAVSGDALSAVEQAALVFKEAGAAPDVEHVELPTGADLSSAVRVALARMGRVFGAAHVVAAARSGRYDPTTHGPWLEAYPFAQWSRRERQIAPPLVVSLDGADLKVGGLAEFLDGGITVVLVVRDDVAPPAALVRLISPRTFVAQTLDGAELALLVDRPGPSVVAWVPAGSAGFVHDPDASSVIGARLRILSEAVPPRRSLGGQSAAQLADELRQLEAMAGLATASAGAVVSGDSTHPVDRLAAWILTQADVSSVETTL